MSEKQLLSPKIDIVFQSIFGEIGDENIVKSFFKCILKQEVKSVDLSTNPILRREYIQDKLGILDVIAKINENEQCNIEMQLINKQNITERILYYWSKLFSKQIKAGEDYRKLQRTIVILLTDYEVPDFKELACHTTWNILERENGKHLLTDKLEIHIIELSRMNEVENEELLDWLTFLENPDSERVKIKMNENEGLKEAVNKLYKISEEEYMQRIADLREKAIMDEKAEKAYALEEGIKEGIKEGKKEGIKEGELVGEKRGKIEIAKNMLKRNMNIMDIVEITGLSKEEVEKILENK